ncbi:hypothetical protein QYZ88_013805 [Lachnospiraceae bacterium C1.1]|nr:hypothetical protein [Lachnospiraceae bacterium C1.1]
MKKNVREKKVRKSLKLFTSLLLTITLTTAFTVRTADAAMVKGTWVPSPIEGIFTYLQPNGAFLADGFTEDGYYVNKNGLWAPGINILGATFPSRNSWCTQAEAGDFTAFIPAMKAVQKKLSDDLHGYRVISVYNSHIVLNSVVTSKTERTKTARIALYKNPDFNGYTIQICTPLSGDEKEMTDNAGEWSSMALYDFQVLRAWMNLISRCGDKVAEAIYSSWDDTNEADLKVGTWTLVGDTQIKYVPSNGAGLYEIKAAF